MRPTPSEKGVGRAYVTAAAKQAAMEDAGIQIAATPSDMADALIRAMKR